MRRLLLAIPLLSGCYLDTLLRPQEPPKTCTVSAYWVKPGAIEGTRDTVWLGTQEVACPK